MPQLATGTCGESVRTMRNVQGIRFPPRRFGVGTALGCPGTSGSRRPAFAMLKNSLISAFYLNESTLVESESGIQIPQPEVSRNTRSRRTSSVPLRDHDESWERRKSSLSDSQHKYAAVAAACAAQVPGVAARCVHIHIHSSGTRDQSGRNLDS
jgi:hypothetical protein